LELDLCMLDGRRSGEAEVALAVAVEVTAIGCLPRHPVPERAGSRRRSRRRRAAAVGVDDADHGEVEVVEARIGAPKPDQCPVAISFDWNLGTDVVDRG